jgi:hypothetical protein
VDVGGEGRELVGDARQGQVVRRDQPDCPAIDETAH